jgi:phosphate-selective porin OprO/OprP
LVALWFGGGLFAAEPGPESAITPETNAPTAQPARVFEINEGIKGLERRPQDDFQIRLHTNAPPETTSSTNRVPATENSFHWDVTWEGWNGLHMGMSQRTPLKTPREMLGLAPQSNAPALHLEQLKLTTTIGGVFELDGAVYKTDGNFTLADDIQLRRARLKLQGDCILLFPFSYKVEIGYIPHKFNLNQAWISSERLDYIGYIVAGVYQPPMGLDLVTSSRDLTFMEPATAVQALAPANEAGIQIGHPIFNERATWTVGIFGGGVVASEYGNASQDYGNLIGRLTWLAMDHSAPPDRPKENRYLHLGLSANVQYSASSIVRYQSRPESYLAEHIIDTGNIDASASGAVGGEAAYVNGPFSLQGEFLDSIVREDSNGERLNFYGFYANASWYLTGESRPYDRINGCFKRLIPRRNFDFGRGGAWGAFEVAARFSYTDLDDGDVHGGRVGLMMGELNWYLHSHVRWMFNAGGGHVSGGVHDGNILLFQTRVGVDF